MVTETMCSKTSGLSRINPISFLPQDFIKLSLQPDCPLLPAGLSELEPHWPLQVPFSSCEEGRCWVCVCVLCPSGILGRKAPSTSLGSRMLSVEAGLEERGTAGEKIGQFPSSSHSIRAPDVTRHGVKHGNS